MEFGDMNQLRKRGSFIVEEKRSEIIIVHNHNNSDNDSKITHHYRYLSFL